MNWTNDRPTRSGYYWLWCKKFCYPPDNAPVLVSVSNSYEGPGRVALYVNYVGDEQETRASKMPDDAKWYGPIEMPTAPEREK